MSRTSAPYFADCSDCSGCVGLGRVTEDQAAAEAREHHAAFQKIVALPGARRG
jgi:hypothetical protein